MESKAWQTGFLGRVPPACGTKLLAQARTFRFAPGEIIFREGDASTRLYLIKSGEVDLEMALRSGAAAKLTTVGPGDVFSWSAMVEPYIETATARAVAEVEVLGIERRVVEDLCWEDLAMGLELYRTLAGVLSSRLAAARLQALGVASQGSSQAA